MLSGKSDGLNYLSITKFIEVDNIIHQTLTGVDNTDLINFISIGSSVTPCTRSGLKLFLMKFGVPEDEIIKNLSDILNINMFDIDASHYVSKFLTKDVVLNNNVIYSANPIWIDRVQSNSKSGLFDKIGSITRKQLRELPEYNGYNIIHPEIIYRKLLQDAILSAYEKDGRYISIYKDNNDYMLSMATDIFQYPPEVMFINNSQYSDLCNYIIENCESEEGSREKIYSIEINDRLIKAIVEVNIHGLSFELLYRPKHHFSIYNGYSIPYNLDKRPGLTVLSYEKSMTKDFILSTILRSIGNNVVPAYFYDEQIANDWTNLRVRYSENWKNSKKLMQSSFIICSLNEKESISSLIHLLRWGKPIVLITQGINVFDTMQRIRRMPESPSDIDNAGSRYYHYSMAPAVCPYCSSSKILREPVVISSFIESSSFIQDGSRVSSRHDPGCDKCTFGISETITFVDSLLPTPDFLHAVDNNSSSTTRDLLKKFNSVYISSTSEKTDRVMDFTIDPNDIIK